MAKIMVVSDMHGENPCPVIRREIRKSGVEKLVCLGDYDTPEILRAIVEIKIPKIIVAGNHELCYFYGIGDIFAPYMKYSAKQYAKMWGSLKNRKEASLIRKSIESGLLVEEDIDGRKVAYAHAGLIDRENPGSKWHCHALVRLDDQNIMLNLLKMQQDNYWVVFRGHGHSQFVISTPWKADLSIKDVEKQSRFGSKHKIEKDKRYLIGVGAFLDGEYALFDTKTGRLAFKDLRFSRYPCRI